jgi:osmoprotectant transport system permease protein
VIDVVFLDAFTWIWHNGSQGTTVTGKLGQHMMISLISIAPAVVIGILLGIVLGHIHRFSFLAINISNLGRALPSLGILAICLPFLGVGSTPVIIAMVILAFPPILTNSYVAIDEVDPETVDAAKGIGMKPWQVLVKVELPLALPLIFAGVRTSAVFVVATATLAGIFGGGGMGEFIVNQAAFRMEGVIGATYVLIALCFCVQGVLLLLERLVTPVGLRSGGLSRQAQTVLIESGIDPQDPEHTVSERRALEHTN